MDLEQRVERLEYLTVRLATTLGRVELLPDDIHPVIGEIVREMDQRNEERNS
jgi:hypothetical protein